MAKLLASTSNTNFSPSMGMRAQGESIINPLTFEMTVHNPRGAYIRQNEQLKIDTFEAETSNLDWFISLCEAPVGKKRQNLWPKLQILGLVIQRSLNTFLNTSYVSLCVDKFESTKYQHFLNGFQDFIQLQWENRQNLGRNIFNFWLVFYLAQLVLNFCPQKLPIILKTRQNLSNLFTGEYSLADEGSMVSY